MQSLADIHIHSSMIRFAKSEIDFHTVRRLYCVFWNNFSFHDMSYNRTARAVLVHASAVVDR